MWSSIFNKMNKHKGVSQETNAAIQLDCETQDHCSSRTFGPQDEGGWMMRNRQRHYFSFMLGHETEIHNQITQRQNKSLECCF